MPAIQVPVLQFNVVPVRSGLAVPKRFDIRFGGTHSEHVEDAEQGQAADQ